MKKFILCLMLLSTTCVFAEEKKSAFTGAVETMYADGKEMVQTLYPDLKAAIVSIAGSLGVAAEHVYTILTKKYVVEGLTECLIFLFGLFFFLYAFIKANNLKMPFDEMSWREFILIVYFIIGIAVLVNVDYTNMLMGLINPEFGAINYIIEYSRSMIN